MRAAGVGKDRRAAESCQEVLGRKLQGTQERGFLVRTGKELLFATDQIWNLTSSRLGQWPSGKREDSAWPGEAEPRSKRVVAGGWIPSAGTEMTSREARVVQYCRRGSPLGKDLSGDLQEEPGNKSLVY